MTRGQHERQRRIDQALAVHPGAPDPRVQSRLREPQPLPATLVAEAIAFLESPDRIAEQHELEHRARTIGAAAQQRRREVCEARRVRSTLHRFAEIAAHGSRLAQCGRPRPRGSRHGARRVARARRTAARSSDDGGSDADGPPDGVVVGTKRGVGGPR